MLDLRILKPKHKNIVVCIVAMIFGFTVYTAVIDFELTSEETQSRSKFEMRLHLERQK